MHKAAHGKLESFTFLPLLGEQKRKIFTTHLSNFLHCIRKLFEFITWLCTDSKVRMVVNFQPDSGFLSVWVQTCTATQKSQLLLSFCQSSKQTSTHDRKCFNFKTRFGCLRSNSNITFCRFHD